MPRTGEAVRLEKELLESRNVGNILVLIWDKMQLLKTEGNTVKYCFW